MIRLTREPVFRLMNQPGCVKDLAAAAYQVAG